MGKWRNKDLFFHGIMVFVSKRSEKVRILLLKIFCNWFFNAFQSHVIQFVYLCIIWKLFSLLLISGISNKEIHIHGNFRLEKKFKTLFTIYKRERGERIKKITNRHTNTIEIKKNCKKGSKNKPKYWKV